MLVHCLVASTGRVVQGHDKQLVPVQLAVKLHSDVVEQTLWHSIYTVKAFPLLGVSLNAIMPRPSVAAE